MVNNLLGSINSPEIGQNVLHPSFNGSRDELLLRIPGRRNRQRNDQDVVARECCHQGGVVAIVDGCRSHAAGYRGCAVRPRNGRDL